MADQISRAMRVPVSNGTGLASSRPTAPPFQTGSPSWKIPGPRMIMKERAEREARQKAEPEQMEQSHAEEATRSMVEERRQEAERRAATTGAGGIRAGGRTPDALTQRRRARALAQSQSHDEAQARMAAAMASQVSTMNAPSPRMQSAAEHPAPLRPRVPQPSQPSQQQSCDRPHQFTHSGRYGMPGTSAGGIPSGAATTTAIPSLDTRPMFSRNTFPHAFERWEALSAHWEGLTSYWINKLEENVASYEHDPINAGLHKQVNDLAAAGANLFHAVVELQRLRASSERKFQRWFYETRLEIERLREANAVLESTIDAERANRQHAIDEALHEALSRERNNSKTQKQLLEMRKELSISKDEARRAWEELGRREQDERERLLSLQQGVVTSVGGVRVVPMMQAALARGSSLSSNQGDSMSAQAHAQVQMQTGSYPAYSQVPTAPTASALASGPSSGSYQPNPSSAVSAGNYGSEASESEGEYMVDGDGNYVRDGRGKKIPFRSPSPISTTGMAETGDGDGAELYETPALQPDAANYPPSSSQWAGGQAQGAPEYSGQGYAAPGWDVMPRHHHPTRLSDVLEEDERTSVSQISRA